MLLLGWKAAAAGFRPGGGARPGGGLRPGGGPTLVCELGPENPVGVGVSVGVGMWMGPADPKSNRMC